MCRKRDGEIVGGGGRRKRGGEKGVRTVGAYKIVNSLTVTVIRYQFSLLAGVLVTRKNLFL
jgi:hypothetical protein